MKQHEIHARESGVTLTVEASTKAGLLSEALLAFAEACGVVSMADNEPQPEIQAEREFKAEGADANKTLAAYCRAILDLAGTNKETYLETKLTLVTDKKVVGTFLAIKTGQIPVPWQKVVSVKGPEKNDKNLWHAEITMD